MFSWLSRLWCRTMHEKAMWPIHGRYVCPRCFREYAVDWDASVCPAPQAAPRPRKEAAVNGTVTACGEVSKL